MAPLSFLHLPVEIRHIVYDLIFTSKIPKGQNGEKACVIKGVKSGDVSGGLRLHGSRSLLCTCHEIYNEATGIIYRSARALAFSQNTMYLVGELPFIPINQIFTLTLGYSCEIHFPNFEKAVKFLDRATCHLRHRIRKASLMYGSYASVGPMGEICSEEYIEPEAMELKSAMKVLADIPTIQSLRIVIREPLLEPVCLFQGVLFPSVSNQERIICLFATGALVRDALTDLRGLRDLSVQVFEGWDRIPHDIPDGFWDIERKDESERRYWQGRLDRARRRIEEMRELVTR